MKARPFRQGISWLGAIDWNRRLFDCLIPLPEGTSYNCYLVQGAQKTALLDSVDPSMADMLFQQLQGVERLDYVVAHHAEQDHSGTIPAVLQRFPAAEVLCTPRCKSMLVDHLGLDGGRIRAVEDGERLDLGGKTLQFLHMPWVHWPETMVTHLAEDGVLFSCDFFGSHLAVSTLYAGDDPAVLEAAKRYYAEIMMPYRRPIAGHLRRLEGHRFDLIAPSHGPLHDRPAGILAAYREWVSDRVANAVVLPYISMHGSTELMVNYLISCLAERDVKVQKFELSTTDIGKLAMALVDAATIVIGAPTVNVGPHPSVFLATHLANTLRPKLRYAAVIGSYGWGTKAVERIAGLIPDLKVEMLSPVLCKGRPRAEDYAALTKLADEIQARHAVACAPAAGAQ